MRPRIGEGKWWRVSPVTDTAGRLTRRSRGRNLFDETVVQRYTRIKLFLTKVFMMRILCWFWTIEAAHMQKSMPSDSQLELFDLPHQTPQAQFDSMNRLALRPDHAVLLVMTGLIGCSIVFACGVERGKQLARAEQPLLSPRAARGETPSSLQAAPESKIATSTPLPSQPASASAPAPVSAPAKILPRPTPTPRVATPTKRVAGSSRFAIQVVSYTQTPLAQRELQRLQHRGEQAFIVKKENRVVLLIGPFPSKAIASAKLTNLKPYYQDCFIRAL